MKIYFGVIVAFIVAIICLSNCEHKPSYENSVKVAKTAVAWHLDSLAKLESINYDSLYKTTPYKEWGKIDELAYGRWSSWDNTKLSAIKRNIDYIADPLKEFENKDGYLEIHEYSLRAEKLHNSVVDIRTKIFKKKYPKEYKLEQKAKKDIEDWAKKVVAEEMQRKENERVMREVRKHYKETYTITQTPYGSAVSVSYTRK